MDEMQKDAPLPGENLGIVALTFGILSLFLCGPFAWIPAFLLSFWAMKTEGGRINGKRGILCVFISIMATGIAMAVFFLFFATGHFYVHVETGPKGEQVEVRVPWQAEPIIKVENR